MLTVCLPFYALIAFSQGAYSSQILFDTKRSVSRAVTAATCALMAVLGLAFYLKISSDFSRLVMGMGLLGSVIALVLSRYGVSLITQRWLGGHATSEIIIVDGVELPRGWGESGPVVHAGSMGLCPSMSDPLMLDRIARITYKYDRVIIACPPERRREWALAMKGSGVDVEVLAPELDAIGTLRVSRHENISTAVVACGALGLRDRAIKRLLDLAIVCSLVPLLMPVLLLVALAIKLESGGPVLFVQKRVGRGNRMFPMYKFRSMRADMLDGAGSRSTARNDERITRVGRLLRATSIDELPQLLNVLKGDMSIAGPRPHAVASTAEDKLFWELDERYFNRHAVKPGLTGLAQVRGYRGATLTRMDLANRVQADLEYLTGWTIWRDIAIIARTFRVLIHRNAF